MTSSPTDNTEIVEQPRPFNTRYLELRIGGTAVSHLSLVFLTLRFGAATVRCAYLSDVGTGEEFRNRGYCRYLIEHTKGVMRREGAALALVDGIPNFYHRFGYVLVQPTTFLSLYHLPGAGEAGDGTSATAGRKLRPFRKADLAAVRRLYERGTLDRTGAAIRPEDGAVWSTVAAIPEVNAAKSLRVLEDEWGEVVAYAWRGLEFWKPRSIQSEGGFFLFAEAMAANQQAAGRLIDDCCAWAQQEGQPQAGPYHHTVFYVRPDDAVGQAIRARKSRVTQQFNPEGGFRAFVLETPVLLTQLLPELDARMRATGSREETLLGIQTDAGSAGLLCGPQGVRLVGPAHAAARSSVIPLTAQDLAQMAFGVFDGRTVYERACDAANPAAAQLLNLLFPLRTPFTHPVDSY